MSDDYTSVPLLDRVAFALIDLVADSVVLCAITLLLSRLCGLSGGMLDDPAWIGAACAPVASWAVITAHKVRHNKATTGGGHD